MAVTGGTPVINSLVLGLSFFSLYLNAHALIGCPPLIGHRVKTRLECTRLAMSVQTGWYLLPQRAY